MRTRRRTWLTNGLIAIAAVLLTLGLAELGVRLFYPQPTGLSHQDRFGLAMHWPRMTRFLPQYGHDVSFNSAGMRDREHAKQKEAGVFRILVLGDSFMEALQVPFEASLPSQLERALQERTGKRVEVVNAGVSGWGTDDELRYLKQYGRAWRPDLVLVAMTLHNDISDNLRMAWHTVQHDSLVERPRAPMSFLRYKIVELKAFVATRLQLYQLWSRVRHGSEIRRYTRGLNSHVVQLFQQPAPLSIAWGLTLTALELKGIQAVAAADGGRAAVVLLPLRWQLSDERFAELVASADTTVRMELDKPQRAISEIARRLEIPVIDLLPVFRQWTSAGGASLYHESDGHWNEAGHRLATDAVARGLVEAGVMKP